MLIGATCTFAHDFFITPSDVIKQRLQLCKNLTARQSIKNIMENDGIRGLYRSYPITVFMNVPFQSMVVCVNENMKTWIKPWER
jgi:solute carrier family 25 iron transporter 28/37